MPDLTPTDEDAGLVECDRCAHITLGPLTDSLCTMCARTDDRADSAQPKAPAPRFEYRLRWQRLGRGATSQIMQTERGAREKAERMLALDEEKLVAPPEFDVHPLANMPDLESMSLERRPVGGWERCHVFDVPEPNPESIDAEDPNAGIEVPW